MKQNHKNSELRGLAELYLKYKNPQKRGFKIVFLLLFALFFSSNAFSQNGTTVKGKVQDTDGVALPGAVILEKGTNNGTISDIDGNFSILLGSNNATLIFSFIGYTSQEIEVGLQTNIVVDLKEDATQLDEIVVVGYGIQKKVNLTGSVSTIKTEELAKVPVATVSEALIGKAPGLFIQQTQGVPGKDVPEISIRGFGSPLVLVDGVEVSFNRMDPNEIETISVLKDAAAAIYGARAGNGVILITTKRGKSGEPAITYSNNFTFQTPTVRPNFLSSWKRAELLREGELNNQLPYSFTESEIQLFKDGTDPDYPNEDWYDATLKKSSFMQQHTLGVSGGNEKTKYFLSAGFLSQGGLYRSGDLKFERYNVRSNIDVQVSKNLKASFDLGFRNELSEAPSSGGTTGFSSLDNIWFSIQTALPNFSAALPDPTRAPFSGFLARSPAAQTIRSFTGFDDRTERNFFGRVGLNYTFQSIEGLALKFDLNYSSNDIFSKTLAKPFEVFSYNYASDQYQSFGLNGQNKLNEETSRFTRIYPLISLNYNRTFGNHDLGFLALGEGIDTEFTNLRGARINLLSSDIPFLFSGSTENIENNSGAIETGRVSYVGRLNYAYKSKYLFEATIRFDASHKFPTDTRWGTFPSISAGWKISEESFIKDNFSFIENLKIRASYSKAGNDDVQAFKFLTGYQILTSTSAVYLFGDDLYRQIRNVGLPNPQITWLDNTTSNIGLDASFANGLISFEADVFYRLTENIFGQPLNAYPSTFGAVLPELNINSTTDRGFELVLNHRNRIGKDLRYQLSGSVSYARQKYKDYAEPEYTDQDEIRIFKRSGNFVNRWIGYKSNGLFMSQDEIDSHPINQDQVGNKTLRPGDIKFLDLNGDDIIDFRDQDEIGYGDFPDMTYGFNMQLDYKGFSLSALFQGASLFNNNINAILRGPLQNDGNAYEYHYKYRWQPNPENPKVNINPDARLPAILGDLTGTNPNNNRTSDFWLQDGTFMRLRNLNIGYNLPKDALKRLGIKSSSLSLSGTNLFTWSKLGIYKDDLDPEQTTAQKFYPLNKTISIGIHVTL
ncbi:MAG: TonB-dependent receptor [Saprospiraceae bacterium]|nr:TonB-dependent receptor [Saprospiraceae bacterium]